VGAWENTVVTLLQPSGINGDALLIFPAALLPPEAWLDPCVLEHHMNPHATHVTPDMWESTVAKIAASELTCHAHAPV
jgi:hypothetical protein